MTNTQKIIIGTVAALLFAAVFATVLTATAVLITRDDGTTTTTTTTAAAQQSPDEMMMEAVWGSFSYAEQQAVCDGVMVSGIDAAAAQIDADTGYLYGTPLIERKLAEWCGLPS